MKNQKLGIVVMLLFATTFLSAQMPADSVIQKMKFFEFMIGEWEGDAVITSREGKLEIRQHEEVTYNLDGTILNIEGTGTNEAGEVVFNAFGTIFYDQLTNQFKMYTFKSDGLRAEATIETLGPGEFNWSFSPSPAATVKYHTKVIGDSWIETGAFTIDKENWITMFNMELTKL